MFSFKQMKCLCGHSTALICKKILIKHLPQQLICMQLVAIIIQKNYDLINKRPSDVYTFISFIVSTACHKYSVNLTGLLVSDVKYL